MTEPTYEQFYARVQEVRQEATYQNAQDALLRQLRLDPGFPFRPAVLEMLAEFRRTDLAQYHFIRGVFAREMVPVRELDEAVAQVATPNGQAGTLRGRQQITTIDWTSLAGRTPPPRAFVLPDWIPAKACTLLHGFGGVGKSLLAQQIGTAAILGCQFLGGVANACPVIGWWGEDDPDEIWRRQEKIDAAFGIENITDLQDKLHWWPCPDTDITLFTAAHESDFRTTPLFDTLREQIMDLRARLVFLDSTAQIAAIPESSRPLVTRCIQALTSICIEANCAIVLIGHNNRDGDFSGSTAWENRVRSRVHMKREKDEDGAETIKLCRPKANYAASEDGVALEWHDGAYRCTDHRFETYGERLEREMRERQADQAFLDALDKLSQRRIATSHSKHSSTYAPRVMTRHGVAEGFKERDLERAMDRLFKADRLVADAKLWQRPNRHFASGLARKS